jgi:hypothetical protein
MSAHRQHAARALRRYGHPLDTLALGDEREEFHLWLPQPETPILLSSFADAVAFAEEVPQLPVEREVLVLLDEHRRITALLLDPPPPLGVLIGRVGLPGLDVPFRFTLTIVVADSVEPAPPDERHRSGYFALRRIHMLQGLVLLDILLTDGIGVQSLAFACDPDPVWVEPFGDE